MSSRSRRAGVFDAAGSEDRFAMPATGDERRMLAGMLGAQRATLELKCSGLVLIHMIEEYARHNGHADLLRERIDGVTGV
ncbi:DUF664 domain-containing protein [Streptomyces sp. ISL-43]|nr:DUF664 domain-containing protein [Streptomyces sp. ISL-43]